MKFEKVRPRYRPFYLRCPLCKQYIRFKACVLCEHNTARDHDGVYCKYHK